MLEYEVSNDGRWVVYKGREPSGSLVTGDLYAVDLDNPGAQPVPVNPPLDFVGGERMGSFAISPDNRRVTYSVLENVSEGVTRRQAYLADLENPGTSLRISAEINTRTMEARFSPDGTAIIYRNASGTQTLQGAGRLFWVGISDPLQPSAAFQLSYAGVLNPGGWQIMPQGDRILSVPLSVWIRSFLKCQTLSSGSRSRRARAPPIQEYLEAALLETPPSTRSE